MGQAGASTAQLVLKQSLTDRPGNLELNPDLSAPLTVEIGINRGMGPMEAGARSDMDGTSSGPHQVSDQTQFNLFMEYACDGIADVTLYFQFKMNCS